MKIRTWTAPPNKTGVYRLRGRAGWIHPSFIGRGCGSPKSLSQKAHKGSPSPDRGFVKSRAHDHFSPGAEPRRTSPRLMVRLPSKLRGRFETTKNPVVRCGTLVLGRPGDGIFTYSAGRRLESENNPGKDQTGNRCTLVFTREKTRNKQNECTTQCVHGRGPACVIAWKMVLRNTGV